MTTQQDPAAAETAQTTSAPAVDLPRLVRVFWNHSALETGLATGPFLLWMIGDRLFHDDGDKAGYFCGFVENAEISDANH